MPNEKKAYVTVYKPIAGWKAIHIWWNPEGFWEPYETSQMAFDTREEAEAYAKDWATAESLEYRPYNGDE